MITQTEKGIADSPGGGGGGITFDATISVGDISRRTAATTLGRYVYNNAALTPNPVGGIPAGSSFTNQSMTEMWNALLYAHVNPSVVLTLTPGAGLREYGNTVVNPALTAAITAGTDNVTFDRFYRGGLLIFDDTPPTYPGQPGSGNSVYNYLYTVSTAESYTVQVGDGIGLPVVSNVATYSFCYPYFYGVAAAGLTAQALYAAFNPGGKIVQNQTNTVRNFAPVAQYYYFLYPATIPNLAAILDQNGFNITADFTLRVGTPNENIVGLDGTSRAYKVYEFNNVTSLTQNITFNY